MAIDFRLITYVYPLLQKCLLEQKMDENNR
jgi:hypothetical protein